MSQTNLLMKEPLKGEGIVEIPAVLAAAQEVGAKWVVVEQDVPTPGKIPMECAKESMDYLRSL